MQQAFTGGWHDNKVSDLSPEYLMEIPVVTGIGTLNDDISKNVFTIALGPRSNRNASFVCERVNLNFKRNPRMFGKDYKMGCDAEDNVFYVNL